MTPGSHLPVQKDRLKPLWILISDRWGGPEQVAVSDMVEMSNADVTMSLLCLEGSPVHAAALRHPRIKVHPFNHRPRKRFDWSFVRALRAFIEEVGANIVHINDDKLLWYLVPALSRRPDISIISSRHAIHRRQARDFYRRFFLRRLDYMIVLSDVIKQNILGQRIILEKKVKVVNLGLDFSRFDPTKADGTAIRKKWGAEKDTIVIGSVGRLMPEVGQDTFLKAAAGLLKHDQWKMRFVIIGEDPVVASEEYAQSLNDLVRQFHMEDVVTFGTLGDNLPEVMAAFDIYVMPGREEVPGLGALEALAMERPVVLANTIGAEDIVGNKEYGLLVRPDDAFDLQSKILNLLQNPGDRLNMGVKGRSHALGQFDKRRRLEKSLDLYERCLRRRYARQERLRAEP